MEPPPHKPLNEADFLFFLWKARNGRRKRRKGGGKRKEEEKERKRKMRVGRDL